MSKKRGIMKRKGRERKREKQIVSLPIPLIQYLKEKANKTFIPMSRLVQIALENYYIDEIKELY